MHIMITSNIQWRKLLDTEVTLQTSIFKIKSCLKLYLRRHVNDKQEDESENDTVMLN